LDILRCSSSNFSYSSTYSSGAGPIPIASQRILTSVNVYTIYYLATHDLVPVSANIIGLVVAIVAMAGPMVLLVKKAQIEIAAEGLKKEMIAKV
jgi:hypothetical protein